MAAGTHQEYGKARQGVEQELDHGSRDGMKAWRFDDKVDDPDGHEMTTPKTPEKSDAGHALAPYHAEETEAEDAGWADMCCAQGGFVQQATSAVVFVAAMDRAVNLAAD